MMGIPRRCYLTLLLLFVAIYGWGQTYIHTVTDRDNIYRIAKIYSIAPEVLANINGLDSVNQKLLHNQKLIIPDTNYKPALRGDKKTKIIKHRIERNESLFSIAQLYGIMVFDILELNPNIDREIDRNRILLEGDEIRIPSTKTRSQSTHHFIYLNGNKIHELYDLSKSEEERKEVEQYNEKLQQRIEQMYKKSKVKEEPIVLDSFLIPEWDKSKMSRWIYNLITYHKYPDYTKMRWIDSMHEELFYALSETKKAEFSSDAHFISMAQNILYQLNQQNPTNDYFFALRAMLYYWLGNKSKSRVYADEAILNNPKNKSALYLRAVSSMEDHHYDKSIAQLKLLTELYPTSQVIQYNLATSYYYKLEFSKSIELYTQLRPTLPEMGAEINYRIGHSLILIGDEDHGCEFILEASAKNYPNAHVLRSRHCK